MGRDDFRKFVQERNFWKFSNFYVVLKGLLDSGARWKWELHLVVFCFEYYTQMRVLQFEVFQELGHLLSVVLRV